MSELIEFKQNVKELLEKYNDGGTPLDISRELNDGHRVMEIIEGAPEFAGQMSVKFPCIFVHLAEYEQELASLGNGAHRNIAFTLDIYPCTQYGAGVFGGGATAAEHECLVLTENIHSLLREKYNLSMGSATQVVTIRTSFDEEVEEATYVKMNKISAIGTQFV